MNKSLRQLFTIVVALFVILGMSTTIIMAIRANQLTNDARNVRALYHEYGAPRGSILAADGSVIAKSDPSNDSFSYQRSYSAGELYAPVTGFFSISQRGWSGVEASRSSLLSGQSEQLLWQRFKSLFTGQENKGANIETSIDPKIQQAAYNSLGSTDGAAVAIEPKTGRILAMVSTPSYDPNQLASHDMSQANSNYGVLSQDATNPMLNRATSQLYPPGSTFKTVVAAAALETGQYQPDTQIPAGASYTLPGTVTQLTNAVPQADGADAPSRCCSTAARSRGRGRRWLRRRCCPRTPRSCWRSPWTGRRSAPPLSSRPSRRNHLMSRLMSRLVSRLVSSRHSRRSCPSRCSTATRRRCGATA